LVSAITFPLFVWLAKRRLWRKQTSFTQKTHVLAIFTAISKALLRFYGSVFFPLRAQYFIETTTALPLITTAREHRISSTVRANSRKPIGIDL